MLQRDKLAKVIDHTCLNPDATTEDIKKLCEEAEKHGFGTLCVYPSDIKTVKMNTDRKICAVVGFPSGREAKALKSSEAAYAMKEGADEIDVVIKQGYIKEGHIKEVIEDLEAVKDSAQNINPDTKIKVICENCNLTEEEKIEAYKAAEEAGADFIKTSTGFCAYGAKVEDVKLMSRTIEELNSDMGIKASGGIRSFDKAKKLYKASSMPLEPDHFRIGASSSVKIINDMYS